MSRVGYVFLLRAFDSCTHFFTGDIDTDLMNYRVSTLGPHACRLASASPCK